MSVAAEAPLARPEVQVAPRQDQFTHLQFTEADSPLLAQEAWRVHAEGYHSAGFIDESAINEHGWLPEDIDKSRGPNIDYFLAQDTESGEYEATVRKNNLSHGGSYKDFPGYKLCENGLTDLGEAQLKRSVNPKEITALAGNNPAAVHESIRNMMHDSIGKDEVWFFTIVSTTYDSLAKSWGRENLTVIGEDTPIDDPRVNEEIQLRPGLLRPDKFNDTLLRAYQNAESPKDRAKLRRSFLFYTEGLDERQMSQEVYQARQELQMDSMLTKHSKPPAEWSQPVELDLSTDVGRAALAEKFEAGEVSGVIDRIDEIANELFEIRHPDQKDNLELREEFVDSIKEKGSKFGQWFLFPWSGELVRYPEESDHRDLRTARNKNLITEEEQKRLYDASVFVGGLSVGSNVVRELVTSGIGGTIITSDPDRINPSNLNRINGGMPDVGRHKVDHAAIQVSEADPYINQVHLQGRITKESLETLKDNKPDIIFDEVDDLSAKVALREFAKSEGVPLVMATDVGERSIIDVERHDLGDVQPFNGSLPEDILEKISDGSATPEEIRNAMVQIVGLGNISNRMMQSVMEVGKTLPGMPQLGSTASKGGALASTVARQIILDRDVPTGRYTD